MKFTTMVLALASASVVGLAFAADPPVREVKNSAKSEGHSVTAIDQPNNQADIDLAAAARSALVDDDSLSTAAKNVTLVAANGEVFLRGTVATATEKARAESIVARVVGVKHVANHIEIKTP